MTSTDKSEWILLDTNLSTRKAILPAAQSHLYFELNEPGSGELRIPLGSRAASLISSGMFCQCFYRGQSIGGFFVDNLKETQADQGEHGGRWLSVSGRGALALLEDAVVWNGDSSLSTRKFTGVTKASMLIDLINEAKARGGLTNLTYDFTAALDSDSASWTGSEDYTLNVGTSLLDVLREFAKTGIDFDINLSGGNFVLSAYQGDLGTDLSETIYFRTGVNCEEVTKDERGDEIKNAILAKYRDGYISVTDPTSIAARRRREKLENVEVAQTAASATTFASAKVSTTKDPQLGIAVRVFDGVGPRLFLDYSLGDYVMLDVLGTETRYRALGIQADFDGDQFSNVVVEFNTLLYDKDMRMANDLDSLIKSWTAAQTNNLIQVSFWSILSNAGKVWDLIAYNGILYVVGEDFINSQASRGISRYNIATGAWSAMSTGFGFIAYAVVEFGGNIYVASDNGYAGPPLGAVQLWKWNGTAWVLENLLQYDGVVHRMLVDGGYLYFATEGIDLAGGETIYRHVAKWDGTANFNAWSSVGSVSDSTTSCNDLAIYNGNLHGAFNSTTDGGLQVFSGGVWSHIALTSLSGRNVQAIAASGGNLVIASGDKIGIWDGVSADLTWIGTLSGGSSIAYTIETFLSDIYVGGNFTTMNGVSGYNYVAKYSGGAWSKLGNAGKTGVNNLVHRLLFTGDDLYVGGEFTAAGGKATTGLTAYRTDFQTVPDYLAGEGMFDMAAAIHNATASAITDSDEVGFWEDVSNALRKITWANIKATLKTYFDSFYITDAPADGFMYGRQDADWAVVSDAGMAGQIFAASADVIIDGDYHGFLQSASGLLKKITWENIKATLKAYFDTLYILGQENFLINGGFDFAQRQAPGTLTNIADNKYSADRWRTTRENADVQFARQDATGETGLTSKYYGQFKKITNTGKFHIVQILEGVNSVPLRSKTVIFQAKMKASASKTIRMAVLELQNAGTIDTIPATLVTAFGSNSVDPTLGANVAVITAAQSKSVTSSWQSFSISVTVPSNSKNIICAIWTDSQFAANDTLSIAEAGLFYGSAVLPWVPRPIAEELVLSQRYYEKGYALDSAPGTSGEFEDYFFGNVTTNPLGTQCRFRVIKRGAPTMTIYDNLGASGKVYKGAAGKTASTASLTQAGVSVYTTDTTSANELAFNWVAEAEL